MRFEEGFIKKYRILRDKKPSIYNLEELYFKVLPLALDKNGKLYLEEDDLTEETFLTVNFPEFLDTTTNLSLIKSIHFLMDVSLNLPGELEDEGDSEVRLLYKDTNLKSHFGIEVEALDGLGQASIPPDLYKLFLGYRHTPLIDVTRHISGVESVASKRLVKMDDECFSWIDVTDREGVKQKTSSTSVLKFKIVFDLDVLRSWINTLIPLEKRDAMFETLKKDRVFFNLVLHPPYVGRMSFKNSISIVYPQRTSRLKTLDRITFKTNDSFVVNNKLYQILIIDKESDQRLFIFDSVNDSELFSLIKQKIDTRNVNSYFDKEIETFDDGVVVDFSVPYPIQMALAEHMNYKIRIVCKDLTTLDIGAK